MRRTRLIPGAVAILSLVGLGLVGCSQSADSACDAPADNAKLAELVSVTGEVGEVPEVDVYTPFNASENSSTRITAGEGTPVSTDTQVAILDFTIVSGATGDVVYQSGYDGTSGPTALGGLTQTIPALAGALHCAADGSRTVIGVAPGGILPEAAASLGLEADDSAVVVVDLTKVYLPRAEGSLVFNPGGLPAVVRAPDGRPGVTIPEGDAPSSVASQTLIRGNGATVEADSAIRVNYIAIDWDSQEVVETSWDAEPASLSLANVVPDIADALVGQTVGSQVLVVMPAADGSDGTQPRAAQIYVFDILGIDPVAGQ